MRAHNNHDIHITYVATCTSPNTEELIFYNLVGCKHVLSQSWTTDMKQIKMYLCIQHSSNPNVDVHQMATVCWALWKCWSNMPIQYKILTQPNEVVLGLGLIHLLLH